jgi:hypothetical protein
MMITPDQIRNSAKFGSPLREVLMEIADRLEKLEAAPKWVGLTVNEKLYSNSNYLGKSAEAWHGGVAWAEAKLKEKNGG